MARKKQRWDNCGLCGQHKLTTREHVFPRGIYPASTASSRIQRITIAACATCNNGTSDDDAHLRTVLVLSGDQTDAVDELWNGPVRRALNQVDGVRRARDVFAVMRPAPDAGPERWRIFPADDPRVMASIRKIVRGLCRYHDLHYPVADGQVFADVQRGKIPEIALKIGSTDPEVCRYGFLPLNGEEGMLSAWVLQFYGRTNFVAVVCANEEVRARTFG